MTRSLLFHGGPIATLAPGPAPAAVLVTDGAIAALGDPMELRRRAPRAEPLDLGGACLYPGFTDTHTHFFELARRMAGVDLSGARNLDEVRALLRAFAERMPEDQQWVGGSGWARELYPSLEGFDRFMLDEIFPDHPVALEARDFHTMWCNTRALEEAGVLAGKDSPLGGEIGRFEDGSPDGFLIETAWELIWDARPVEPEPVRARWTRAAVEAAHRLGLTGFHSMEKRTALATYEALRDGGELGMRVCFHSPLLDLDERIERGKRSYQADDPWIRWGGVKIFMDGSLGSRSAWMIEPYPDGGHGRLLRERDELESIIERAARAGIAPSIHAIGDATVRLVIDALEGAVETLAHEGGGDSTAAPGPGRSMPGSWLPRIEHAQCVRPEDIARLARLSVLCAMQPAHLADDIDLMPRLWPTAGEFAYPMRSLLGAGVVVSLGSDAPVATLDPIQGILAAVGRRAHNRPDGRAWGPKEAWSVAEAVAGYTLWAARAGMWEQELGSIEPGKRADLTAFDASPDDPLERWREAKPMLTMVDGRVAYADAGLGA